MAENKDQINALKEKLAAAEGALAGAAEEIASLKKQLEHSKELSKVSARMVESGLSAEDMKEVTAKVSVGLSENDAIDVVLAQKANDERVRKEQKSGKAEK